MPYTDGVDQANEPMKDTDDFILAFDPISRYSDSDRIVIAAAIVYGRRLGLQEGRDLALKAMDGLTRG